MRKDSACALSPDYVCRILVNRGLTSKEQEKEVFRKKGWLSESAEEAANYQECIRALFFRHSQSWETTFQEVIRMTWGQI